MRWAERANTHRKETSTVRHCEVTASAWIDRVPISYAIYGDEVELQLGEATDGLFLAATESGLERLAATSAAALHELRVRHDN